MQPSPSRVPDADQIDLKQVFGTLRRYAPWLLLAPVLAAGGTYALSKRQPPVYEATTSVIALDNDAQNSVINNTLVTAPPLPQGAVDQVVHSRSLVRDVVARLKKTDIDPAVIRKISGDLENELASGTFSRLKVRARLDTQQRGVYELRARGETPHAAQQLAQVGVESLIAWDNNRAKQGVIRSRNSLQAQLRDLGVRIQATPVNSLERQSLVAAQGSVLQNLSQVAVLETAASGTLVLVADSVEPRAPVSPRPLRNAALAGLLALFLSVGGALLTDSLRRRVNGSEDLLPLGLPVLGQLPLLRRRDLGQGFVQASQNGPLYEGIGFLRINVQSLLQRGTHRRLVMSSAYPSEGKSSVTAALAQSMGASGLKVLVIDADLRRPSQSKVWGVERGSRQPLPGTDPTLPPAATLSEIFLRPEAGYVTRVAENVDLLPAGAPLRGAGMPTMLNQPTFRSHLERWSEGYDFVLIDSPPMLSLPDTLAVAPFTEGVMLVVEAGKTRLSDVERTIQNARVANVPILGFVVNKIARQSSSYYYAYGYGSEGQAGSRTSSPQP
ncbi:tyrosine-protein kinase domain-containing protein [Deinococcus hopiensis]|uniref:Non-specific protein-tyrosine kinase n=1 Tax=Deinococcus hopiensis KR-140 TaxID=695939 RepID=A0A1W1UH59_9DEIO|nr:tyrosine-protein kinase domain-containing protein [Deinococcus hopiensis]SMB80400.1 non-specific protein-tyrosine kinase [Deinococcus hopiensis KR-140]